jgi:ABC-type transport system involved in multi-copper enzyme maturation permease subunit
MRGPGLNAQRLPPMPGARFRSQPFSRGAVAALCWSTFLEAVRDKILYLLLFFGIFVFAASRLLSPLALGQGRRITLDLGFAAISAFGCLTTIFVGHQLIFREIERKTLYFLFSRPLRRSAFVWGKYFGLLLTLSAAVCLMGLLFALVLLASHYPFGWSFVQALLLSLLEFVILGALAVLLAAVTSPVLAGLFTLAAWIIGHGSSGLSELLSSSSAPGIKEGVRVLTWLVPRLDLYGDILPVHQGVAYPAAEILFAFFYAAAYATAALLLASVVLSRRELAL